MNASSSRQRLLSLWLDRLPVERIARRAPEPPTPLVICGRRGNVDVVVALDVAAEQAGLRAGLTLAQTRAMRPDVAVIEEDAAADARLLETMADACLRYTPLTACDAPDGLLLDITGCAHLYGGEQSLRDDLAARLTRAGFSHRIAIAGTIGAAHAAAHHGETGIYGNGAERDLLSPLPLAALRLPADVTASMARVGLKRIGDIVHLPRAPLAARFGIDLLRQLDRALGNEHEPLCPRLPVAPYLTEQRFAEPIAREEDVLAVIERLAARLARTLTRHDEGARHIELTLFRTDGAVRRIAAGTSRPLRDPKDMRALFTQRLAALADELDPGFGFDLARLSITAAAPHAPEQIGLAGDDDAPALHRLVDQLSARLGPQRVRRPLAQDSHAPELTAASLPAQQSAVDLAEGWDAFRRDRAAHDIGPRPLRLLTPPEPIEALAEVPDGPPLRFRWRRALHEVIAAEGPERIEGAWWKEADATFAAGRARDYFRVEDKTGLRFWLFRAGLYRDIDTGETPPRWYLHGTFA